MGQLGLAVTDPLRSNRDCLYRASVDLQAEGCPGGYADITEPKGFIYEVEVIMEAFARCGFQRGVAGLLVMPGVIDGTGLHGLEDMDQAGMITALG